MMWSRGIRGRLSYHVTSRWLCPSLACVAGQPRAALLADAARDIPPRPQALPQRPLQLQHVVSAMTGITSLALSRAILAGARAP